MLQFLPSADDNTIAIRASGKLTHKDYKLFLPLLEEQIATLDKVSILFELDDFSGWELDAAKDDLKFGMKHFNDFERIAIVGDKSWEHWMAVIANPFLSGEIHYFNRENLQDAWDWLREKKQLSEAAKHLQPYENILVAVDFSLYSAHACKRAIELAQHYKASLTLAHVVKDSAPIAYYGDSMDAYLIDQNVVEAQNQLHVEHAEVKMKNFVGDLDTDFVVDTKVLTGKTKSAIVSFLEAQKINLAVFGVKKKKGLTQLLGSTPHYVQNHARCDTLIVPVQVNVF